MHANPLRCGATYDSSILLGPAGNSAKVHLIQDGLQYRHGRVHWQNGPGTGKQSKSIHPVSRTEGCDNMQQQEWVGQNN
ncbi:hypothetical protein ZWY2020_036290 [Hordeum vulgare]|nr:hypothetical protein ZWY2020_036290 [Hordeum vulgare]